MKLAHILLVLSIIQVPLHHVLLLPDHHICVRDTVVNVHRVTYSRSIQGQVSSLSRRCLVTLQFNDENISGL